MDILPNQEPGAQAPDPKPIVPRDPRVDAREQLANHGETGAIHSVSIPEDMITELLGIMLDFDPDLYNPERLPKGALESPRKLYESFVGPMLARHPVYAKAEVRDTGRGLHAILRFRPTVTFKTEAERDKWKGIVRAVQKALPTDPRAPGITAMTRPIGSINGKTGRTAAVLKEGQPVSPDDVLKLVADLQTKPFKVIAGILFGPSLAPCPVCSKPGTRLGAQNWHGLCYGGCGKPTLGNLYDAFYASRATVGEG